VGASTDAKKVNTMAKRIPKLCGDCKTRTQLRTTSMEFVKDGIRVSVSGIPAMVCPRCGTVSMAPGVSDSVARTAREMLAAAKRVNLKDSQLKECLVVAA
jgi:YgiT-type zinc finger domain-containing protein